MEIYFSTWYLILTLNLKPSMFCPIPSTVVIQLTLNRKMTIAQVVETSVTVNNNSPNSGLRSPGRSNSTYFCKILILGSKDLNTPRSYFFFFLATVLSPISCHFNRRSSLKQKFWTNSRPYCSTRNLCKRGIKEWPKIITLISDCSDSVMLQFYKGKKEQNHEKRDKFKEK